MFKELSEEESLELAMYPLCTITNQPISNQIVEDDLRAQMSIDDIITAKLQYGVEPHIKEMQFCTLPYDLPGEVWKPLPKTNDRYLISNKLRVKTVRSNSILKQRRSGEVTIWQTLSDRKSLAVNTCAYTVFGPQVIPLYPNTKRQHLINHKLTFGYELDYTEIRDNRSRIDMPGEIWKPLLEYNGAYEVSNMGRVKSMTKSVTNGDVVVTCLERIMAIAHIDGYYSVIITEASLVHTTRYVHHLVMQAFQPRTEEDIRLERIHIDHINGNKHDNRYCNLRYVTISENVRAANNMGKCNTKLPMSVILNLGYEYEKVRNCNELGRKYGVNGGQILKCVKGLTFSDVNRYIPKL